MNIDEILTYWFSEKMSAHWFSSTPEIDDQIRDNFSNLWEEAKAGKKDDWENSAEGCLALCIVLDQFPLNMYRGQSKTFSTEQLAVSVCKHAIENKFDEKIDKNRVAFLYMPLMHSENLADQDLAVALFEKADLEGNIRFAKHHRDLIIEFGRFPHRNKILERESTPEELKYLSSDRAFTG